MALRPSAKKRTKDFPTEVTLILAPMIDILTNIMCFLLLTFSITSLSIGTIETSLPLISDTDTKDTASSIPKKNIVLTVTITEKGFIIKGKVKDPSGTALQSTHQLGPQNLVGKDYLRLEGQLIPKNLTGHYDCDILSKALMEIKREFPDEDTLFIIPEPDVLYDDIVKTMDSSREIHEISADGMRVKKDLFPNAV